MKTHLKLLPPPPSSPKTLLFPVYLGQKKNVLFPVTSFKKIGSVGRKTFFLSFFFKCNNEFIDMLMHAFIV